MAVEGSAGFPHPGYLDAALAAPRNTYHYGGPCDLYDLAAACVYHIAKDHAFTDGNKRTAYAAALVFLTLNGVFIRLPENELQLAQVTLDVERGVIGKAALSAILRDLAQQ